MPIVPTEPTAIDLLIELEDRVRRTESGCGAGTTGDADSDSEPLPTDTDLPTGDLGRRAIVLRGSCKKGTDGETALYPQGTPWRKYSVSPMELVTVEETGAEHPTPLWVRIDARFQWDPQEGTASQNASRTVMSEAPRSLLFKLPPGYWPANDEVIEVPLNEGAAKGLISIERLTGHVYFIPQRPIRPFDVDLSAVTYTAGGGKDVQGDGTADPTGGACGSPWEDDNTGTNTPELTPVDTGGGTTDLGDWTAVHALPSWTSAAYYRTTPLGLQFKGYMENTGSGGAPMNVCAQVPYSWAQDQHFPASVLDGTGAHRGGCVRVAAATTWSLFAYGFGMDPTASSGSGAGVSQRVYLDGLVIPDVSENAFPEDHWLYDV